MNRRDFSKTVLSLGAAAQTGMAQEQYQEPARKLPARRFDVVVAGGGTAGVVAAIAAARQGAKTILIEAKGYPGGTVVEGGTTLHSFYNLWKPFPGVAKKNIVRGIPKEIVDRLLLAGGASGYPEMLRNTGYDSVCTVIDTEMYKLTAFELLDEAGVFVAVNTLLCGAVRQGGRLQGVITESRSGREVVWAKAFIDCTGYGDLSAHAGARATTTSPVPTCSKPGTSTTT